MGGSPRLVSQITVLAVLLLGAVVCAVPTAAATGRSPPPPIIEGDPAGAGEYPAHGFLQVRLPTGRNRGCGGTLVGTRHFLTAAHCAVDDSNAPLAAGNFAVLLGDVDLTPPNTDWYGVNVVDVHTGFDNELRNDVAVLKLDRPALGYAPLPVIGTEEGPLWAAGTMARIVGWGMTESGSPSSVLLEADVPIVGDVACGEAYGALFYVETMVCAGDGVHDTCQGDSGGPLMAWSGRSFVLVGITSWGFACAHPVYPGVYARLGGAVLSSWVDQRVPRASFTYAREPGGGASLRLTSTSSHPEGPFATFNWDFDDDGGFDDGAGATVVHTFPAEGTYAVSLEASMPGGDRAVVTRRVNTSGEPVPPPAPPPPPPPPPPAPPRQRPPCPPGRVTPGATYRGFHAGGGDFCLTLTPDFSGVTSFVAYNVAGNGCHFDWYDHYYVPPVPIVSLGFSQSGNANLSGYFTTDRLGRSVASGTFSLFFAGLRPCFSGYLTWTATTDASVPWANPPQPPAHPPLPRAQVRCRVPRVIGRRLPAARSRIRARNCRVGKVVRRGSKKVGRVIGQKPRAGAVRARNFRVTIVVGRR